MKRTINGRVVGHRLFMPDPKQPDLELVKIELAVAPIGTEASERNSRCILIATEAIAEDFPLGAGARITIEDTQQVLPLARANAKRKKEGPEPQEGEIHH